VKQLILILLFIPVTLFSQFTDDERVEFAGMIYSEKDSCILNNVHVINMTSEKVTASFREGNFYIPVNIGDQLLFSSIGYRLQELIITDSILESDDPVQIYLTEQIYMLETINVWPYQTFAQFKQAFLDLELEEEALDVRLPKAVYRKDFQPGEFGKVTISGPITALYMAFSKEGKSIRKYNKLIQKAEYDRFLSYKYNSDIVQTVTGIKDETELQEFMEYCDLTDEFIINSIDYKIYLAIKDCYLAYLSLN